ncbi:MAG TPA: SDR family NAD(P)-dependent oxidoreductase [Candidatus Binataceae bacterium]|nr:SDR family NAD(P)-dependent oxidoreductase [Candidatus Binataceae bacterium]
MAERALDGKVAIVTGAASPIGLGREVALAFVKAGARVAMVDVDQAGLEARLAELRALAGPHCAAALVTDTSDPVAVDEAVRRTIADLGGLHIVVNNAGLHHSRLSDSRGLDVSFWEVSPATWSRVIAVNLSGPFFLARAAVGHLRAQKWGRIIGVTTSLDTMYRKGGAPYGPSKAAHEAFIATIAQDLEGSGVTANVLVPGGAANTNMIPAGAPFDRAKLIQPSVMQAPAVWLASAASDGLNGRRLIAFHWDERLPLKERLEKASAPAAWPQLGAQAVLP